MYSAAHVAENLEQVRANIARICGGKNAVRIVAVTKTHPVEAARAAAAAGCHAVGENYAQESVAKFANEKPLPLHFIGHVQTNKVKTLAGLVDVWQTLDRIELAREIAKRSPRAEALLQVNVSGEGTKSGCAPAEAESLLAGARDLGLVVNGLMTVAPAGGGAEVRATFRGLRALADSLGLVDCAMGMSGDYEVALEEGATILRLGTVLFGAR